MGRKSLNLINRQFGKFTVIGKLEDYIKPNRKHVVMWRCRCKCGKEYDISEESLLSGADKICDCGWGYFTPSSFNDLTGKKFGRLLVIKRAKNMKDATMWECLCECGHTVVVNAYSLLSGNTKSCGCYRVEVGQLGYNDITNLRFGKLVALEKIENNKNATRHVVMWRCLCDCGNITEVSYNNLVSGTTKSCGCLKKEQMTQMFLDDLTGKRFGNLTVMQRAEDYISPSGAHQTQWECLCDCGRTTIVNANSLKKGLTKSCGCLLYSNGEDKILKILQSADIAFEQQKTFDDCRFLDTGRMAKFDFYVNNNYIVEYDGEQHFKPVAFNGSQTAMERFDSTKQHDLFKNQYCFQHNIPIVRIPYTHLNNICIEDLMIERTQFILNESNELEYYKKHGGR